MLLKSVNIRKKTIKYTIINTNPVYIGTSIVEKYSL
jgi:hypothetical protein